MKNHIVISSPAEYTVDQHTITLDQVIKRKVMRRRRVAKRMAKRFPLFAVEYMQAEFPGYTQEQFIEDISRKTRKRESPYRKKKSPMQRQCRWSLYQKALLNYRNTGEQKYLQEAQQLRNKMYSRIPVRVTIDIGGKLETKEWRFPSDVSLAVIQNITKQTFSSWEEQENFFKETLGWSHIS